MLFVPLHKFLKQTGGLSRSYGLSLKRHVKRGRVRTVGLISAQSVEHKEFGSLVKSAVKSLVPDLKLKLNHRLSFCHPQWLSTLTGFRLVMGLLQISSKMCLLAKKLSHYYFCTGPIARWSQTVKVIIVFHLIFRYEIVYNFQMFFLIKNMVYKLLF